MEAPTQRRRCAGCGCNGLMEFLNLSDSPPANTPSCTTRYPLRVGVCVECWLAQLLDVVPDDVLFDDSYTFYSRTSPPLVEYDRQLASELLRFAERGGFVVEVGSNDGSLLENFARRGLRVLGVDPAVGPAKAAESHGIQTATVALTALTGAQLAAEHGRANLIIAKNVAAHVANVRDFFMGIASLLSDTGVAVIEVQYLADMLVANQFDQVYHEHRYFYSLTSLRSIAAACDLDVVNVQRTEPQGGSIRATLKRHRRNPIHSLNVSALLATESWLRDLGAYVDAQRRAEHVRDRLLRLIDGEIRDGRDVVGYAAPAKATTLLNFCGVDSSRVGFITDAAPSKQGTLLPGTDIPIVRPVRCNPTRTTILVTGWNYTSQIVRRELDFIRDGGRLIVPLPNPTII